jgi:DNA-binding response OmpR family regulator
VAPVIVDAGPGVDAARRMDLIRRARSDARVLYLSDHGEEPRTGLFGLPMLAKPFSVDALVGKVREVLWAATD